MTERVAFLEGLIEKIPSGRARQRYEAMLSDALQGITSELQEEFTTFVRWAAQAYEPLPSTTRQRIFPKLQALQDQADEAFRQADGAAFRSILAEARRLLSQARDVAG